ncbi:hypothetical protein [Halalkalibacillus halophilus]|uniref:hypothetical protein n=1 Tax=Halalkalibacillus halophilus TaxID=392827 RepID=UPI0003FD2C0C|nr:hypothetical protein [Halalkalibacillus halophilus]
MTHLYIAIIVGIISSTAISLYFYIIEAMTGKQLFTLLLNIDFIYDPSDGGAVYMAFEYSLHVFVAISIVLVYLYWITRKKEFWQRRMEIAGLLTFIAFLTYFPLTMLANTTTPAVTDAVAIFDWFVGHVIFFFNLYYLSEWLMKKYFFD